jgi:DNA-binding response OmpR family regulator
MEMRLLEHLMLRSGEVVTRSELHDKVWDMHFDPSSNLVDAHIARLRGKLKTARTSVELVTRRGLGFVLRPASPHAAGAGQDAYGVNKAQS